MAEAATQIELVRSLFVRPVRPESRPMPMCRVLAYPMSCYNCCCCPKNCFCSSHSCRTQIYSNLSSSNQMTNPKFPFSSHYIPSHLTLYSTHLKKNQSLALCGPVWSDVELQLLQSQTGPVVASGRRCHRLELQQRSLHFPLLLRVCLGFRV